MHPRRHTIAIILVGLLLLIFAATEGDAQRENNIWYFGSEAGIDFNGTAPVPLIDSRMNATEGSATVSDPHTGELLFYTDGITVWNRDHQAMPNGTGLPGGYSSTQAALIVPAPGDSTKYYLFSSADEGRQEGVSYAVVDMTADGGRGDVIERNVQLLASASEKMVGIHHCNGVDYWVVVHGASDDRFHAYLVDRSGVSPVAVVSRVGTPHSQSPRGWLAASPDARKLACLVDKPGFVELLDIDNCTGVISNPVRLIDANAIYGVCFSPDNSKLYVPVNSSQMELLQIDLSAGNARTVVGTVQADAYVPRKGSLYALQLAPDGRIYGAKTLRGWLAVIERPNLPGRACGYIDSGFSLGGRESLPGLPNIIHKNIRLPRPAFDVSDTILCQGSCIRFTDRSSGAVAAWSWRFPGGTPELYSGPGPVDVCYDLPGRYPVILSVENQSGRDQAVGYISVDRPAPPRGVAVGSVSGAPGDTVLVELRLTGEPGTGPLIRRPYLARFRCNRTMMAPVDENASYIDVGDERLVTVRGAADPSGATLGMVRMLVLLGDTDRSPIIPDSVAWYGGCADAIAMAGAGELVLTGLCVTEMTRLLMPGGWSALRVSPIGGDGLGVDYHLDQSGPASLYLVDMLGRRIATLAEGEFATGSYRAAIGPGMVPRGRYLCVLRTSREALSLPLLIER